MLFHRENWPVTKFVSKYEITIFFGLTFVLSWFPWYAGIAAETFIIGPSIAAFIIVAFVGGWTGLKDLLRPFGRWRASPKWWAIALFGPAILFTISLLIYLAMGGVSHPFTMVTQEFHLLPVYLFLVVLLPVNGPVGEEFGWRGFAQPRLQAAYGPLLASCIIGAAWGIWHLPSLMNPTDILGSITASLGLGFIGLYVLVNIASSIFITYIYNKTRMSALIAAIGWHASTDFWAPVLLSDASLIAARDEGILPTIEPPLYLTVLAVLVGGALILTIATKGKLGSGSDQNSEQMGPSRQ